MKVAYISVKQRAIGLMAGLALITVGIVVQSKLTIYLAFFGTQTNPLAILLMAMGAIVFIIGFFGCCGAYRKNYCLALAFATALAFVIVAEVAAALTAYFLQAELELYIISDMLSTMHDYNQSDVIKTAWDTAQKEFDCCGVTGYRNWEVVFGEANNTSVSVPDSCCVVDLLADRDYECTKQVDGHNDTTKTNTYSDIYTEGCAVAVRSWMDANISIIISVCVGLALVQLTGIVLTCCLARNIRLESGIS